MHVTSISVESIVNGVTYSFHSLPQRNLGLDQLSQLLSIRWQCCLEILLTSIDGCDLLIESQRLT